MFRFVIFTVAFLGFAGLWDTVPGQPREDISPKLNPANKEAQLATVKVFYSQIQGDWSGSYRLWLRPSTPAEQSEIRANIQPVVSGHYFLMTYSWKRAGKKQEGVFFFGGSGKTATASWGDSFHMIPEPMYCKGELQDGGKLIFHGSYSFGNGPSWGWRTEFTHSNANELLMEAYNITPDGVEALAVKAELKRILMDEK
ncbi:MAG: hypothetical protein Kow0042_14150 [Calditrichia bacterium]